MSRHFKIGLLIGAAASLFCIAGLCATNDAWLLAAASTAAMVLCLWQAAYLLATRGEG